MQASGEEKTVGGGDASAVFASERVAYRVAVLAPTACYSAAPGAERVDDPSGDVTVTRVLTRIDGICAQVVTEVAFEGDVDGVGGALGVTIVDEAGRVVKSVRFERPT